MIDFSTRATRAGTRGLVVLAIGSCFALMPGHRSAHADGQIGHEAHRYYQKARHRHQKAKVTVATGAPTGEIRPGGTYNWPYSVTNKGPVAAKAVTFATLPNQNLKVVSGGQECVWQGPGKLVCRLGGLKKGETKSGIMTATVAPNAAPGSTLASPVTVSWHNSPEAQSSAASFPPVKVVPATDLAVVNKAPRSVRPGQAIPYQVTVTNKGASPAQNVVVRNSLPGKPPVRVRSVGACAARGMTYVCQLGAIPPGKSITVALPAKTRAGAAPGKIPCLSTVASSTLDVNMANNSASCMTRVVTRHLPHTASLNVRRLPATGDSSALLAQAGLGLFGVGLIFLRIGRPRRREDG